MAKSISFLVIFLIQCAQMGFHFRNQLRVVESILLSIHSSFSFLITPTIKSGPYFPFLFENIFERFLFSEERAYKMTFPLIDNGDRVL